MQLFVVGLFIGGVIGSVVIAVLTSGKRSDEVEAYNMGYQAAMQEVKARHKVRAAKAAKTRKGKA
jgi:gas vesicle protein